jgi:hypothetical protein
VGSLKFISNVEERRTWSSNWYDQDFAATYPPSLDLAVPSNAIHQTKLSTKLPNSAKLILNGMFLHLLLDRNQKIPQHSKEGGTQSSIRLVQHQQQANSNMFTSGQAGPESLSPRWQTIEVSDPKSSDANLSNVLD